MDTSVEVDRRGPVASVTLAGPEAGNVLTTPTFTALTDAFRRLAGEPGIRVLRLGAKGPDFSLGREGRTTSPDARAFQEEFLAVEACNEALAAFPGVSVAVVRGRAAGAGLSLAARCDVVLAAEGARLSFPEIPRGIAPTIVLSYFGKKLLTKPLVHMLLTGREVDAYEGQRLGLVSEVVAEDRLQERADELCQELAALDGDVVRISKAFLAGLERMTTGDAARYGIALLAIEAAKKAAH